LRHDNIIIHPSATLLPIDQNWARIVSTSTYEYITLIGHDDVLKPDYLAVMNELIDKYPAASLYQTHFNFIDNNGKVIRECKPMPEIEDGKDFLRSILTNVVDIMGTGFLMKATDYKRIGGIPQYPYFLYADFELWQSMAEISFMATSPKICFDYRVHQSSSKRADDMMLQVSFFHFIDYLIRLKKDHPSYEPVFEEYALTFMTNSCKGLAHRMLRTPLKERQHKKVKEFVRKCNEYLAILSPKDHQSINILSIRAAIFIDSNSFTRQLFLWFKKIVKKPILGS